MPHALVGLSAASRTRSCYAAPAQAQLEEGPDRPAHDDLSGPARRAARDAERQQLAAHRQPAARHSPSLPTGFRLAATDTAIVWGRPNGIAVARDGALLVADDTGDTLWRISYGTIR